MAPSVVNDRMQLDKNSSSLPRRKDLPQVPDTPNGAAWFWGAEDELGRVNLLTPARVKEAAKEVLSGDTVPLNLELSELQPSCFGRSEFQHSIKNLGGELAFDDFYSMNTQSSTQWDGLRHWSHLGTGTFYNGIKGADILGPDANSKCGMHAWAQHGIVGRGVLLDFATYAEANGISFDPYDNDKITHTMLVAVGKLQGIDIRPESQGGDIKIGDILLIRSGFLKRYRSINTQERVQKHLRANTFGPDTEQRYAGVEQSEEILDWLHDCYFSAIAGDAPAFEAWPSHEKYYLHEYIIALWGCPLGELWDLETLADKCKERKRWTFLLTSSPANVAGGIGSHANAIAIL